MPIRESPTFDPDQLSFPTGYLGDLLDVNDSGRVHGSTLVFNTGYGDSPGTWVIGTGGLATGSLNSLSDVNVGNVSSGQYLVYQGNVIGWTGVTFTGGATNLVGLTDVNVPSPVANRALIYGTTGWIQGYPSGSLNLMSGLLLADLSASGRQFLIYDGARFINRSGTLGDLSGVNSILSAISGQALVYKGAVEGWQPLTIEVSGAATGLLQSYFSGVYDVTLYGVSNTSLNTGIATSLQTLITSLPDNSSLRFPPGSYWLNKTIHFNDKRNIDIIAHGAKFYETPDRIWMNSGTFYFNRCTGIDWHGGSLSGAANLNYVLSVASGVEMSGSNFENLATDTQLTRNVSPCTFNLEQCSDFLVDHFDVDAKYRYLFTHRGINIAFANSTLVGVHTGWLNRLDESIVVVGTGTAQKGDIDKESARQSFMFNIIKGYHTRVHNVHAKNCGGLLSCGSSSLGGGQGPQIPELVIVGDCSVRNAYDNGIYFSSVNKANVHHVHVICDTGLPHAISAIKGRGNYIIFDHCYAEHVHHAYGIEAIGGNNDDYWTDFTKPGWSSQGSKIVNCVAVDTRTTAAFMDTNENTDTFPRDCTVADNYFYDCARGASGANPTGFLTGEDYMGTTVICANDIRRIKIYNNVIENTGSIGPDVAIYVGENRMNIPYITGAEIYNNTILGAKQGIRIERMSHVRVHGNYGERIGTYNSAPYTTVSGVSALIACVQVKNSKFYNNTLIETGTALCLYVVPGSGFIDNIVRDNDGIIEIN